nr:MAG TPA: hypothetical protein [Siphoviridae sp. ctngg6]
MNKDLDRASKVRLCLFCCKLNWADKKILKFF